MAQPGRDQSDHRPAHDGAARRQSRCSGRHADRRRLGARRRRHPARSHGSALLRGRFRPTSVSRLVCLTAVHVCSPIKLLWPSDVRALCGCGAPLAPRTRALDAITDLAPGPDLGDLRGRRACRTDRREFPERRRIPPAGDVDAPLAGRCDRHAGPATAGTRRIQPRLASLALSPVPRHRSRGGQCAGRELARTSRQMPGLRDPHFAPIPRRGVGERGASGRGGRTVGGELAIGVLLRPVDGPPRTSAHRLRPVVAPGPDHAAVALAWPRGGRRIRRHTDTNGMP